MLSVAEQLEALAHKTSLLTSVLTSVAIGGYVLFRLTRTPEHRYARPASRLPVLGDTLNAALYQVDRIYDWLADQSETLGGPWALSILGDPPNLIITNPELIEDVLKTQFELFQRGAQDTDCMGELFGNGILAANGHAWAFHRKTASSLFSNQMLRDVMYDAVSANARVLCQVLRKCDDGQEPVSFKRVITRFTSDVLCKIAFGVDLSCLASDGSSAAGSEFVDAFATVMRTTFMRYQQPAWLWHLKRYFNIGDERLHRQSLDAINSFAFRIINDSIAQKKKTMAEATINTSASAAQSPRDLISLFLSSNARQGEGEDPSADANLIRDMVVNFIVAGKDTTSHSLTWFIVMMNRYPQVLAKIREELRAKLPQLETGDTEEMLAPSLDDLPRLTYLEAAIRENLRLNPPVPWVSRQANAATVLCDGTPIANGMRIGMLVYGTGRSKAVWGEDALEFKPERWLDADNKIVSVSPFKFAPFIGGPRQCLGLKFAMLEMKCALAVLLSKFELTTVEDPWTITYEAALTMAVKGPLIVKVSSR